MTNVSRPEISIYFDYDNLLWPAKVNTPDEKEYNGVELSRSEGSSEVVWVSSHGEIYRSTSEGTKRVSDQEFTTMAYGAKVAVQQARKAQYAELKETEGRMIEWRPGHSLYGYTNMDDTERPSHGVQVPPVSVFVKKGELYCPYHTNNRLATAYDHGEDRAKWLVCTDDEKCFFDVFIGT